MEEVPWVAGGTGGQVRRTGPAIYIFISSSWRAIGDRKVERKKEKKRKEQRARFEEEAVRKNFGHSPENALIGQGFSIRLTRERIARIPIRDFTHEEKKERDARGTLREQRERHIPAVAYR